MLFLLSLILPPNAIFMPAYGLITSHVIKRQISRCFMLHYIRRPCHASYPYVSRYNILSICNIAGSPAALQPML